jgi:hypothetical protein
MPTPRQPERHISIWYHQCECIRKQKNFFTQNFSYFFDLVTDFNFGANPAIRLYLLFFFKDKNKRITLLSGLGIW